MTSVLSAAATAVLGIQSPAHAAPSAAPAPAPAASTGSATQRLPYEPVCGTPGKGQATCFSLRRTDTARTRSLLKSAEDPAGYGPADLRGAYNLPADGGQGQTVAIVDAFDDPTAEADLAVYRQQFGLPPCTGANGCFTKVDQRGGTDYPVESSDWTGEISLDLDMVSAIAPNARILLVEADDADLNNLGASVDEAVALGAKFVSNSYGSDYPNGAGEDPSETTTFDTHYDHPGVAVVASSGDYGYGVPYPAASQYVTSVGGTSLVPAPGTARGWSETAWAGAGSGCSFYEPKPAFQTGTVCNSRMVADVSAVADLATGVAVYQGSGDSVGWQVYGGTSVSAPIIAGVYADAGTPVPGTHPNAYPYATSGAGLNDVAGGSNGSCAPAYLCTAVAGPDGPTGLGTPDGVRAFRGGPHGVLNGTVVDAATGKAVSGATVAVGDATARTDTAGAYTLNLPAGRHDVTATAFGYATTTAKSVAVTDGGSATRRLTLTPLPSQAVSGRVKDGSGHGWPLYARITVDGVPGSTWTSPSTGSYSLRLPKGRQYTVHATASLPGYGQATASVTVGNAAPALDFSLKADPWLAVTPGYSVALDGPTETFDSTTSAPDGWTVVDAPGTQGGWEFDDPHERGNRTGGDGAFAIVDSSHYGFGATQDSQLISPVYDLSRTTVPELAFNAMFQNWPEQSITADASSDGGTTWTNVWSTTVGTFGPDRVEVPLTDYAGKKSVRVRFHFTASWGEYFGVDNVFVGQRGYLPDPGALVVGNVRDANTGKGLSGAAVTDRSDPAAAATTVATPDDPGLGDGFFSLFSPGEGNHTFTASKPLYADASASTRLRHDAAVSVGLELDSGRIEVTPGSISASLVRGGKTTRTLTVTNEGKEPATLRIGEQSGALPQLTRDAPVQRIKGSYSPHPDIRAEASTDSPGSEPPQGAWQFGPDLPEATWGSAVDSFDGKVYSASGFTGDGSSDRIYALDPAEGTWTRLADATDRRYAAAHGFVDGKFYTAGGWGLFGDPDPKLEIYDPATNSWTTGAPLPAPRAASGTAVVDGKLYTVGGCDTYVCGDTVASAYDPAADKWSAIAPYPEPTSWESCGGIDGDLYCAGGVVDNVGVSSHAYVYDPDADTWSALPDMPMPLWGSSYASANGKLVISGGISGGLMTNQGLTYDPATGSWGALPNSTVPTYRGGGALGLYTVGGVDNFGRAVGTVQRLPGYDQPDRSDTTWLSEKATTVTLRPGASTTVAVTLDSSVPEITGPGDYTARLAFSSDTPYALPHIPVTLHVTPPKNGGTLTGIVYGAAPHGGKAPLAGATVRVTGWGAPRTLVTDATGRYTLTGFTHDVAATLQVSAEGYRSTTTHVTARKGRTTTADILLLHR